MKFPYKKYAPKTLRPVIPIEIIYEDESITYEVLVDSGADCNIFDSQLGEVLGINISSGRKSEIAGITGVGQPLFIHKVDLRVGWTPSESYRSRVSQTYWSVWIWCRWSNRIF